MEKKQMKKRLDQMSIYSARAASIRTIRAMERPETAMAKFITSGMPTVIISRLPEISAYQAVL